MYLYSRLWPLFLHRVSETGSAVIMICCCSIFVKKIQGMQNNTLDRHILVAMAATEDRYCRASHHEKD